MIKMGKAPSGMTGVRTFFKVGTCSETLCNVLDRAYANPLLNEEHASMTLAGGIMQNGYQCGMVWGATLAAGAQAYRLHGSGPKAEMAAVLAAQNVISSFRERYNTIDCFEITDTDWRKKSNMIKFMLKGGPIGCFKMAGKYSPVAYKEVNSALADEPIEVPDSPISCAGLLAKKMGASEMHQTMAAGFAGGIGLSGGGCGALGAAIWILAMKSSEGEDGKVDYKDPKLLSQIDDFMPLADYEMECADITGRKFSDVHDHAAYLHDGGCAKLIDDLAAMKSAT